MKRLSSRRACVRKDAPVSRDTNGTPEKVKLPKKVYKEHRSDGLQSRHQTQITQAVGTYRIGGVGAREARVRRLLLRGVLLEPEALVRSVGLRVRLLSVLLLRRGRLLLHRGLLLGLLLHRRLLMLLLRQLAGPGGRRRGEAGLLLLPGLWEGAAVHRSRGEHVGRVRPAIVRGVRLGVAVQARVLGAPGGGGGGCRGCRGGGGGLHAHAAHAGAKGLAGSLPLPVAVGAARLAPGKAHAAAADGGALHVVDDVLGAGAVRERHEGAPAAGRRGNGVDLPSAGEGVAEDFLVDRVIDAAHEDGGVARIRRVRSCLTWCWGGAGRAGTKEAECRPDSRSKRDRVLAKHGCKAILGTYTEVAADASMKYRSCEVDI